MNSYWVTQMESRHFGRNALQPSRYQTERSDYSDSCDFVTHAIAVSSVLALLIAPRHCDGQTSLYGRQLDARNNVVTPLWPWASPAFQRLGTNHSTRSYTLSDHIIFARMLTPAPWLRFHQGFVIPFHLR